MSNARSKVLGRDVKAGEVGSQKIDGATGMSTVSIICDEVLPPPTLIATAFSRIDDPGQSDLDKHYVESTDSCMFHPGENLFRIHLF